MIKGGLNRPQVDPRIIGWLVLGENMKVLWKTYFPIFSLLFLFSYRHATSPRPVFPNLGTDFKTPPEYSSLCGLGENLGS